MPFSEELKSKVKKQSHFACCLCHAIGVEIHHIQPQSEGGDDIESNAAPLCPTCHEIYGANPQKRKFITEARDFWYELCAQRYASDASVLTEIASRVEQTVSKADLKAAIDSLSTLINPKDKSGELISVELPETYWVIVLAALSPQLERVFERLDELRKLGFNYDNVNQIQPAFRTAMAGTIFAHSTIVDVLVEKGVMKPEAAKMGAKAINEIVKKVMATQK